MPRYEYRCETNDRTVEVAHEMSRTVRNWGEVCELAGLDPDRTPKDAPVRRIVSLSAIGGAGQSHACSKPNCCMRGM